MPRAPKIRDVLDELRADLILLQRLIQKQRPYDYALGSWLNVADGALRCAAGHLERLDKKGKDNGYRSVVGTPVDPPPRVAEGRKVRHRGR